MFADFFIKRPVFSTVTSLFIVIAGAVCIPFLPVAQFPQLAPPQISVAAFYTGANATAVESSVTTILEEAINGVEDMRYMTSTSGNDGSSSINITFELTRPLDLAAVDVQNRVQGVMGRLPDEVKTTGITINKVARSFVLAAGFYSQGNRYNDEFISNYIDIYVKDAIKRIEGVADVQIFGERKYSMRLWLDPNAPCGARADRLRMLSPRCSSRTSRSPPARWRRAYRDHPDVPDQRARGWTAYRGVAVQRHYPEAAASTALWFA